MRQILILFAVVAALSGCKDKKQQSSEIETFPAVEVPATLASEFEAYNYLALHFWDNFELTDTASLNKEYVQRAFVDYVGLLAMLPPATREQGIKTLLDRAFKTEVVYDRLIEMFDFYLYEIDSPIHNEETYNAVLLWQINNPKIAEEYKLRPRELYRVAQKNRVDSKAADFSYATDKGVRTSLYNTRADYTILFFYNLGCEMCRTIREQMIDVIYQTPAIAELIGSGDIKILALYPDKERESWEQYKNDIPSDWINGYDPTGAIKDNEIYELRAIPSVYLLDGEKIVMLKDSFNAEQIFGTILHDLQNRNR